MSFSMKSLTLLLTAIFLNTAYSSSNNTQNNSNNIQNNTIQNNNYSNIGTVCNSCIINNNYQNNLNNNSNNIIQNCNTQHNTYSNINRVCNNCIVNSNIINSNMQTNPLPCPVYFYTTYPVCFYLIYPINDLNTNHNDLNTNHNNTFNDNTNSNQKSNNTIQYDLDTSKFYPRDYCLKQALSFIKENKHNIASKYLDEFIETIQKNNEINIPNNILSNWLETASESIKYYHNDNLRKQKDEIIKKIKVKYNIDYKQVKEKVSKLVALKNNDNISDQIKNEFSKVQKNVDYNELGKDISDLRENTSKHYKPVEDLKQLLINALEDNSFSVQYEFPNDEETIEKIITHLFKSGHILENKNMGNEKHAPKETLINGIESMKYYNKIITLIQSTYDKTRNEISSDYKTQIYKIIQYCLINPLINKFINNTTKDNTYISDFVMNNSTFNRSNDTSAVLCVIDKENHNKLVLDLNIKKHNSENKKITVTNTIKSFYEILEDEYKKYENKHKNYTIYWNEINKQDVMYKKQYENFKENNKK